jgi:hypothetical protein
LNEAAIAVEMRHASSLTNFHLGHRKSSQAANKASKHSPAISTRSIAITTITATTVAAATAVRHRHEVLIGQKSM